MNRPLTDRLWFLLAAVPVAALSACGDDEEVSDSTLLIVNQSDFAIEELFIADVDASGWGPDLLADDSLLSGESLLVTDIECDFYDVLLIDEEGVECELLGLDLCFDDSTWVIENDTCIIFDAARTAADAQSD